MLNLVQQRAQKVKLEQAVIEYVNDILKNTLNYVTGDFNIYEPRGVKKCFGYSISIKAYYIL